MKPQPSKKHWHRALERACELWELLEHCEKVEEESCLDHWGVSRERSTISIMMLGPSYAVVLKDPLWTITCFLMKGIYYMENGQSLSRLQVEDCNDFLVHAAIESLPLCLADKFSSQCMLSFQLESVFARVLELHGSHQIDQIGPVDARLPLHVAAANPGWFCQEIRRFPDRVIAGTKANFADHILTEVLKLSPSSAATCLDANGFSPMQLACLSGHRWGEGLEKLSENNSPGAKGSAGICLAIGTSRVPDSSTSFAAQGICNIIKKSREVFGKKIRNSDAIVCCKTDEGQLESLNSLYQLLHADPGFLFL